MRYLITTIIIALFVVLNIIFSRCSNTRRSPADTVSSEETKDVYDRNTVEIVRFQGCQYATFGWGPDRWGSHMGNCDNPIHKGELRDYQLSTTNDSIVIWDGRRRVGATTWEERGVEAIILLYNQ